MSNTRVILTVTLDCGHKREYEQKIEEKYPFWCDVCQDNPTGKYPWSITARTEPDGYELKTDWS